MTTKNWCAYTDYNYIPRFMALYESMIEQCEDFHLYALTFDGEAFAFLSDRERLTPIRYQDFETPALRKARARNDGRTYAQSIWTCTALWVKHCLVNLGLPEVYYVDGDCFFFNLFEFYILFIFFLSQCL